MLGSVAVVSVLATRSRPASTTATSVNVPPTSTPTRVPALCPVVLVRFTGGDVAPFEVRRKRVRRAFRWRSVAAPRPRCAPRDDRRDGGACGPSRSGARRCGSRRRAMPGRPPRVPLAGWRIRSPCSDRVSGSDARLSTVIRHPSPPRNRPGPPESATSAFSWKTSGVEASTNSMGAPPVLFG